MNKNSISESARALGKRGHKKFINQTSRKQRVEWATQGGKERQRLWRGKRKMRRIQGWIPIGVEK